MPVNLTVCGQTDVGLVRQSNEDAFVVADLTGGNLLGGPGLAHFEIGERGVLLAVSDGMGGHAAGEVASAMVVECLIRAMATEGTNEPSDALLGRATELANREVWQAAHSPGREGM